jgi:ABC-type transporter Mla MlaB component
VIKDLEPPAQHADHAVVLQATESATDGLQCQPEEPRDVLAAHRQLELGARLAQAAQPLAQPVQEQPDALVGLPAHQHLEVILVAVGALSHHPQQLLLQAGQMRRHVRQILERDLADMRRGQSDRLATVLAGAERVEPQQLSGEVETHHLLLARFAQGDRLEGPLAGDIDRRQPLPKAEQALAAFDRPLAPHNLLQPRQIGRIDSGGQAELLQRTLRAAQAQPREVEDVGVRHAAHPDTGARA